MTHVTVGGELLAAAVAAEDGELTAEELTERGLWLWLALDNPHELLAGRELEMDVEAVRESVERGETA